MENKNRQLCALLTYLFVGIIWYFADEDMRKDSFVQFHVRQAVILLIASIAWSILLGILGVFLFILGPVWYLISLLGYIPLILVIVGIINVLNNKESILPVIGGYGQKFTF